MGRYKNLTNCMFGTLFVLKRSEKKHPKCVIWVAECKNCGSVKEYLASELGGTRISCGCIGNLAGNNSPYWKGCGEISMTKFLHIKSVAKRRKICFDISIEYLWKLFLEQNKKCMYSGLELNFGNNTRNKKTASASLDRIDSSKGYIEGNVQWVHKDVNMMKQQFCEERFIELCKLITENKK